MLKRHKKFRSIFFIIFFKKKLLSLLILAVLFLAGFYFIKTDFFTIKKINIASNNLSCVRSSEIKASLNSFGKNIFLLDLKKSKENLKSKFLCIQDITFSKSYPQTLEVEVFRRKAEVVLIPLKLKEASESAIAKLINAQATQSGEILEDKNERFFVDSEGVIFSDNLEEEVPEIFVSSQELSLGKKLDQSLTGDLLRIIEKVKILGLNVGNILLEKDNLFFVTSSPKIIFKLNSAMENQIAALQLILEKAKIDDIEVEFIDLRFDKPVIRYGKR